MTGQGAFVALEIFKAQKDVLAVQELAIKALKGLLCENLSEEERLSLIAECTEIIDDNNAAMIEGINRVINMLNEGIN